MKIFYRINYGSTRKYFWLEHLFPLSTVIMLQIVSLSHLTPLRHTQNYLHTLSAYNDIKCRKMKVARKYFALNERKCRQRFARGKVERRKVYLFYIILNSIRELYPRSHSTLLSMNVSCFVCSLISFSFILFHFF